MGIAGAGFGAAKALEDILAEQMVRAQLAQRERENHARMQLEQQRFAETVKQNEIGNQRQQRLDDERATDRRAVRNITGVRRMMADAVMQGTGQLTDDDRRGLAALQIEAGDDPTMLPQPKKPIQYTYTDPKTGAKSIRFADPDSVPSAGLDLGNEPPTPQRRTTHVVGGHLVDDTGRVLFTDPNKAKTGDGEKPSPYAVEHSKGVVRKINDLIGDPNDPNSKGRINNRTAGVIGSALARMPFQTEARDVDAELGSLAANLAFEQLQKMREASKTGGALGQVSNIELDLLKNTQASIRQDQSPANLRKQLAIIRESAQRFLEAAEKYGGGETIDGTNTALADLVYDPKTKTFTRRGGQ